MAKLFVVSDVHSFYTPLKEALDEAGFDPNNKDHYLISCGDAFDRGPESYEVLKFLMSLERKVLVKGNHDILFEQCCARGYADMYDYHNGTTITINDFGDAASGNDFLKCCDIARMKTEAYRSSLVNYFETEKYIFVHSWIPTQIDVKGKMKPWYEQRMKHSYMEDWRAANDVEWEDAMWCNPFFKWQDGLNQTGKTIVFGHYHCSLGHLIASDGELSEFGDDAKWEPFIHDSIIGIDRCTAHTGEVNVLVLEDNFLE